MGKLSGLTGGQPSASADIKAKEEWKFAVEKARIDFVIKHFAEDNIVYGSDWPVSLLPLKKEQRGDFLQLWTLNLYKYLKGKYGKALCDEVFVANPTRIYDLNQISK